MLKTRSQLFLADRSVITMLPVKITSWTVEHGILAKVWGLHELLFHSEANSSCASH